ncbi:lysophospholipase L1-like esterase [Opitutaceae bacterium TAV1]|nr:lysophospholipase L1-like esterase [Opitutaceae bacterium TAV1]
MNTAKYNSCLAHVCLFLSVAFLLASVHAVPAAAAPLKLAIIGDSTVCDYPLSQAKRGWGQLLPEFLPKGTQVINVARGGASTKTFPADRWQRVLSSKPDYVLIQFGHNDSHAKDKPESTDAATDYRDNLRRYVREARDVGIRPILVTPVRRRLYKNGHPTTELARYADAMKAVTTGLSVPLIDLHATSGELFDRLGEDGSEAFTVNKPDNADRPGKGDRTHFTETGAREIARLVAAGLAEIDARLTAPAK